MVSINRTIRRLATARLIAAATVGVFCLVVVTLAAADVTFVLNNGERHSGRLVYHTGTNIGLIQDGKERTFPVSDVAVILYNDGDPTARELDQLPNSDNPPELERHTLVLRSGRVLHGKVYHWNPDDVVFDTIAGRGTYNGSDVARLYLSGPPARRLFAGANGPPQVPGNNGRGRGFGRGRTNSGQPQTTVRVEANQRWTDTGLMVQSGERIAFSTSGTIEFGKGMTAGPDGDKNFGPRPGYVIRDMPVGGLIGRVGNSAPFPVGSTSTPITMPAGGHLFLGVNDDSYVDNSGGYDVGIYRR
jgi:PA-IL-like protein